MPKCPICEADVPRRAENAAFPFCSPRCKTIDLGKWMNEDYRIPVTPSADDDEDGQVVEPSDPGRGDVRH